MHDPIYLQDEHGCCATNSGVSLMKRCCRIARCGSDGMVPRDIVRKMGELGFWYSLSGSYGVRNSTRSQQWSLRELGRSTSAVLKSQSWFTPTWHRRTWPTRVPKRRKPAFTQNISGELVTAVGVTEPTPLGRRRDRTRATKTNGGWIQWQQDVHHDGVYGDLYFVAAKAARAAARAKSMFILEGHEGFSVARPSRKWLAELGHRRVGLRYCFVPNEHVLGVHRGFYAIMQNFRTNGWSSAPNPWARRRKRSKSHSTT